MMYETRVGKINCDITTFWLLSKMGFVATKLYNTALWNARDTWNKTGKIPSGFDLQKVVLQSPYHDMLPAHTYQHTAHQVGMAFRSWFKLRKKDNTAQPPGFRKKSRLSSFLFTEYGFRIKNSCILLTVAKKLRDELGYQSKYLALHIVWGTTLPKNGRIQQLEIIPKDGFFEIHAKIQLPEPQWRAEGQIIAVDLGQRVPIACADEMGNIDIFKGGKILSDMHYWNKEKARVSSEVMERSHGKRKWSNALQRMSEHGNRQKDQSLHALALTFVKLCNDREVKEVVIGDLIHIKKEKDGTGKNWRDKQSQNWQQFPIRKLVTLLRYKLARYGIRLIEIDERGTSKGRCSLCGSTTNLSRVHRGLFLCGNCKKYQHADVNGARNILHRYLYQMGKPIMGSSGSLADPMVWRWNNHTWSVVA